MAVDYLERLPATGDGRGAAAYHDKRFVLQAALQHFDTAVFVDADSRLTAPPRLAPLSDGLTVLPRVRESVAEHLQTYGAWRLPIFAELAHHLTGDDRVLHTADWCYECCYAVTRDGREGRFFEAWDRAASFLQSRDVYSGEGGVMGLAAAYAGWTIDYWGIAPLALLLRHEAGGPKVS
jgi:hypothetical protein